MPKIEDLEKLGSIAFLIGNKALPKEISQDDYNRFKSVFTDEHIANSMPAENDDLPSIDDLDNLELHEDLDDDKVNADIDDLQLPEDLDDDKVIADIDDLQLPEDLDDDKVITDIDNLQLPEDKELEEKIATDIDRDNSNDNDIHSEKLSELDDLPLPDSLPNIDKTNDESAKDDFGIDEISDSLDDILEDETADSDIDSDNSDLDNIAEEDKEKYKTEDDNIDSDNSDLDNIAEEDKEEYKTEDDNIDSDNSDLDNIAEEDKEDESIDSDSLDLDNITEEENTDLNDLSLDDNSDNDKASNNIVEGRTSLPAPETADSLAESKYEDVDKDIDHDKVINAIKYLPQLTQYHVLDAILNEKLDRDSMENLLNALERGESNENITELLNKELGLSIKEEGRKNILELIPIPSSLKDYAKIIRIAAVFLILFVTIVILSFQFIYKPVMANKYYSQGLLSISRGAYDDAERNFSEGEKLKPKQIKWYNKYARAYIARETFNEALKKIQGALNIKPRDFETRITYGYYHRKKGEKELSREDYRLGEELYNDMLVYTSNQKEKETIYDERGLLMISMAKNMSEPEYYDIAYNNYRDMVNLFGDGVVPRKRAMLIKIYQDDYNQVKILQNHINLLKQNYIDDEVYPKLAKYLLNKDDFYGSRVLFENLLTAYPKNLESIVGYADYETRLKHYDIARDILTNAALPLYDADPFCRGKEIVYNMLGQIYYNLGEYGNAVKNFNEALTINKVYPDANYNLGNVYFYKEKDYEKAKLHYQTAYDNLAPNLRSEQLLYNLSWIYYSDSEYDRAFEGFNALFQKNPGNSVVSYALGNSLLHLDKANLANGFYRNALSQVLAKKEKLGRLEMRTESDFILVSYLASLYNNIGVSYAYNSKDANTVINEQEAFKYFVLASEYFDQIRTSNIDLERMEKRTVMVDNQNVGAATYNIMAMQGRRDLKQSVIIDDYIPKDMYYVR